MAEIKWHPFPDCIPRLPLDGTGWRRYIVTAVHKDRSKPAIVLLGAIDTQGKWILTGCLDHADCTVVAWADLPDPYIPAPKAQSLF